MSVIDTGGKFSAGVVDTGGKFDTGVVDTGGASWLEKITEFSKKFEMTLKLFSGPWGKMMHEKSKNLVTLSLFKKVLSSAARWMDAPNGPPETNIDSVNFYSESEMQYMYKQRTSHIWL